MNDQNPPWLAVFGIRAEDYIAWAQNCPENHSIIFQLIEAGQIREEDYLKWATEFYGLPILDSDFFSQPPPDDFWQHYQNQHRWSPHQVPLIVWDNSLFVGSLEPANIQVDLPVQTLLCRVKDLQDRWNLFHPSESAAANPAEAAIKAALAQRPQPGAPAQEPALAKPASEQPVIQLDIPAPETPPAVPKIDLGPSSTEPTPPPQPAQVNEAPTPPPTMANDALEMTTDIPQDVTFDFGNLDVQPEDAKAPEPKAEAVEETPEAPQENLATVEKSEDGEVNITLTDFSIDTSQVLESPDIDTSESSTPEAPQAQAQPEPEPQLQPQISDPTPAPAEPAPEPAPEIQLQTAEEVATPPPPPAAPQLNLTSEEPKVEAPEPVQQQPTPDEDGIDVTLPNFDIDTSKAVDLTNPEAILETQETLAQPSENVSPQAPEPPDGFDLEKTVLTTPIEAQGIKVAPPPPAEPVQQTEPITPPSPAPPEPVSEPAPELAPEPTPLTPQPASAAQAVSLPPNAPVGKAVDDLNSAPKTLAEAQSFDQVATYVFKEMNMHFDKKMILVKDTYGMRPSRWFGDWCPVEKAKGLPVNTAEPNMFSIAKRTRLPFHGPVAPNTVNETFFQNWNQGQYPEHITIFPILVNSQAIGMVLGISKTPENQRSDLYFMEKLCQHIEPIFALENFAQIA